MPGIGMVGGSSDLAGEDGLTGSGHHSSSPHPLIFGGVGEDICHGPQGGTSGREGTGHGGSPGGTSG